MFTESENSTSSVAARSGERPAKGGRLLGLQVLRAVAALLVVWAHSIDAAEIFSVPAQSRFYHLENFGACGLDIFFVISGFIVSLVAARAAQQGLAQAPTGHQIPRWLVAGHFLKRRITRIFPLYWILTVVLILEGELGRFKIQWHAVPWLPTLLLLPSLRYPVDAPLLSLGWSLVFEMYFYLLLTLFLIWTPRDVIRNCALFLCAAVALGSWIGIRHPLLVLWMSPVVLEFVFGCIMGMVFAKKSEIAPFSQTNKRIGIVFASVGLALLVTTIFTGYGYASESQWILAGHDCWLRVGVWGVPSALFVGGVLFWHPAMHSLPARLMVFLGDASYSIYLCTIPARSVVIHFWRYFGRLGPDMGVFLGAVFCAVVGVFCYLLVERPLTRVFHNWQKPLPFSAAHAVRTRSA